MSSNGFMQLLIGIPWFAWIAMVAIICGTISKVVCQCQAHFERMEAIRHGVSPNSAKSVMPEI